MTKGTRIYNGEVILFNKGFWENCTATCKRMKLEAFHFTKIIAVSQYTLLFQPAVEESVFFPINTHFVFLLLTSMGLFKISFICIFIGTPSKPYELNFIIFFILQMKKLRLGEVNLHK